MGMNPAESLQSDETHAVLSGALRELEGVDARLEGWAADDTFTPFGKRRVVRYELEARLAGTPHVRRYRWLGKFYDRDEDARRVATVLRELRASNGPAGFVLAVPSVLAYHAPRRLLLLTYESGESMTTAMAQDTETILAAIGRSLATLHSLPIAPTRTVFPNTILEDIRPRVRDLCVRFPSEAASLESALEALERDAPSFPSEPSFVHGDFGPPISSGERVMSSSWISTNARSAPRPVTWATCSPSCSEPRLRGRKSYGTSPTHARRSSSPTSDGLGSIRLWTRVSHGLSALLFG